MRRTIEVLEDGTGIRKSDSSSVARAGAALRHSRTVVLYFELQRIVAPPRPYDDTTGPCRCCDAVADRILYDRLPEKTRYERVQRLCTTILRVRRPGSSGKRPARVAR